MPAEIMLTNGHNSLSPSLLQWQNPLLNGLGLPLTLCISKAVALMRHLSPPRRNLSRRKRRHHQNGLGHRLTLSLDRDLARFRRPLHLRMFLLLLLSPKWLLNPSL